MLLHGILKRRLCLIRMRDLPDGAIGVADDEPGGIMKKQPVFHYTGNVVQLCMQRRRVMDLFVVAIEDIVAIVCYKAVVIL